MKKLIVSGAEAFGYGPCSKLVSILSNANIIKSDFFGNGTALTFARSNRECFGRISEIKTGEYKKIPWDRYLAVLSVMDYDLAIWGWWNKKPVIYVDSLFWFWRWKKGLGIRARALVKLRDQNDLAGFEKAWRGLTVHQKQYFAHYLSSCSIIQGDLQKERLMNFPLGKKVLSVGPILDMRYKRPEKRRYIIVNFSGLLSPVVDNKMANKYIQMVSGVIRPLINADRKFVFLINPKIKLTQTLPKGVEKASFSHKKMLECLNKAKLIFTPPGITSNLEAIKYGVPICFLPEQHYGHLSQYFRFTKYLTKSGFFDGFLIQIDEKPKTSNEMLETKALYRKIDEILKGYEPKNWKLAMNRMAIIIDSPSKLRDLAKAQERHFKFQKQKRDESSIDEIIRELEKYL